MKEKLINEILKDEWMLDILKSVRDLNLPDCWIGAGFVRNKAWDILHDFTTRTPLADIDVVFFDKKQTSTEYEKEIEFKLEQVNPKIKWEVINQARTHIWHDRVPYESTQEAISEWVETATCVGARLSKNDELLLIAPHGLEDIEQLFLRPVPSLRNRDTFTNRIESKGWIKIWPKLKILSL